MKAEDIDVTLHVDYLGMRDYALQLNDHIVGGFLNQEMVCYEFQKNIGQFVKVVKVGVKD